jgi:large repetitive protein
VRRITKAALTLAAAVSVATALAGVAAGPASASRYSPSISLPCSAAANNGTLEGTVCVLPAGQTTAPNAYSATIAVSKANVPPTVTFALTAGSLPPGLSMPSQSTSNPVITGNPTRAGTFNFTVKATDGPTATRTYQITITLQGPPDQLACSPAVNGGFLENGLCVLPDAVIGQPYAGHLDTSHQAGGALSVVSGSLPPGLHLPATFTGSGDTIGGTPTDPGIQPTLNFTVQGTGDQGQPLYQAYEIKVDQDQPLTVNTSGGTNRTGDAGSPYATYFTLSGGAAPYTWSVISGQLPPGTSLRTNGDPRDINNELAGTTTTGTYTFTMQVTDYNGQQATAQFTVTIDPPLQVPNATLPTGTVGVPYSTDLDNLGPGGTPPYTWSIFDNDPLPPGMFLDASGPNWNNVLTGTPTQAGTYSFLIDVEDSLTNFVNTTLTITINP